MTHTAPDFFRNRARPFSRSRSAVRSAPRKIRSESFLGLASAISPARSPNCRRKLASSTPRTEPTVPGLMPSLPIRLFGWRSLFPPFCAAASQVPRRTVTMPGPRGLVRPTISRGSFTLALDGLRLASRRRLEGAIQAHWLPLLLRRDVHLAVRHRDEFCRGYLVHPSRDQLNRESEPDHDPGDAARIDRAPLRRRPD